MLFAVCKEIQERIEKRRYYLKTSRSNNSMNNFNYLKTSRSNNSMNNFNYPERVDLLYVHLHFRKDTTLTILYLAINTYMA